MRSDVAQAGYYDTLTTTAGGFTWQLRDPCATALADLGWSNPIGTPPPNAKLENAPVPIFGIRPVDATPVCTPDRKAARRSLVVRFVGPDATEPAQATGAPFLQLSKCELETPNKLNLACRTIRRRSRCTTSTARRSPTSSGSSSEPITSRVAGGAASTRSRR